MPRDLMLWYVFVVTLLDFKILTLDFGCDADRRALLQVGSCLMESMHCDRLGINPRHLSARPGGPESLCLSRRVHR